MDTLPLCKGLLQPPLQTFSRNDDVYRLSLAMLLWALRQTTDVPGLILQWQTRAKLRAGRTRDKSEGSAEAVLRALVRARLCCKRLCKRAYASARLLRALVMLILFLLLARVLLVLVHGSNAGQLKLSYWAILCVSLSMIVPHTCISVL